MDWASGVAMQLVLHWREANGNLDFDRARAAVLRGAVFVDLALDGWVGDGDPIYVDTEVVGFGPADRLLDEVVRHPTRTIAWWIGKGPQLQESLINEWVRSGHWHEVFSGPIGQRRLECRASAEVQQAERKRGEWLRSLDTWAYEATPAEAATAALLPAAIATALPSVALLNACGSARWLVELTAGLVINGRSDSSNGIGFGGNGLSGF